jgi:hypothetical protein
LTWAYQVQHTLTTVVVGLLLLVLVLAGNRFTWRNAIAVGVGLILLPLCGGGGLVYFPCLLTWFVLSGLLHLRSGQPRARRDSLLTFAMAAASLLIFGLYFYRLELGSWLDTGDQTRPDMRTITETALKFIASGFGPAATSFWPWSALVAVCVTLATLGIMGLALWRHGALERLEALALWAFVLGFLGLALVMGLRRADSLLPYYSISAAMFYCWAYFVWGKYRSPRTAGFAQLVLFTTFAMMMSLNSSIGVDEGRKRRAAMNAFEKDLSDGLPKYQLLKRHARTLYPPYVTKGSMFTAVLSAHLDHLRDARIKPFLRLTPDPAFQELALPVIPDAVGDLSWNGDTGLVEGQDAFLLLSLPRPMHVGGIRIAYATTKQRPPFLEVFWKLKKQAAFDGTQSQLDVEGENPLFVWIDDIIDQIKLHPFGGSSTFKLSEITLLIPATGE